MIERERCPICDFPLATEADWSRAVTQGHTADLRVYEGHLCWRDMMTPDHHPGPAIDWRARALKAEAALAALAEETPIEAALKEEAERG